MAVTHANLFAEHNIYDHDSIEYHGRDRTVLRAYYPPPSPFPYWINNIIFYSLCKCGSCARGNEGGSVQTVEIAFSLEIRWVVMRRRDSSWAPPPLPSPSLRAGSTTAAEKEQGAR